MNYTKHMILLEYEAKHLLSQAQVPVPAASRIDTHAPLAYPFVVKTQVPVGGRGKAGGIRVVTNQTEFDDARRTIASLRIYGHLPNYLLAEQLLHIKAEFYISFRINAAKRSIELTAHPSGGVDIEEHAATEFFITYINSTQQLSRCAEQISDLYGIIEKRNGLEEILKQLYHCFLLNDALLLEINPLVLTTEGHLVAADCKMEVDDAALFRHPEWDFEAVPTNSNFVTLNQNGSVATIANGAGLAMATVDAVAAAGIKPANFLDIGGGANEQSVLQAFNEIMKYPNVKAIVINIFAGITRCDEVAKAIIAAGEQILGLPALCIRLAGTNLEQAKLLLQDKNISLMPDLEACVDAAKEHVA